MALLLSIASNLNGEEPFTFLEMLFTCISAFATVGLDLGVTEQLGHFGQAVLMLGMFVGRLGILVLLSAIWEVMTREQIHIHRQHFRPVLKQLTADSDPKAADTDHGETKSLTALERTPLPPFPHRC